MLAPGGASDGLEDIKARGGSCDEGCDVWCEGEVWVESNSQDAGVSLKRKQGVVECDLRVCV